MRSYCPDIFKKAYGPSSCPNIELFVRFQKQWADIDSSQWIPVTQDKDVAHQFAEGGDLVQPKTSAVEYLKSVLDNKSHPRDDYAELILLSFIFVEGVPDNPVTIRTPGAFHQARWMAKAIYALKIYLFREQFNLTARERKAMCSIGLFVALYYVRYWNEALIARYAPKNDLDFMCNLESKPTRPQPHRDNINSLETASVVRFGGDGRFGVL
jgi:hypothetical protein